MPRPAPTPTAERGPLHGLLPADAGRQRRDTSTRVIGEEFPAALHKAIEQ